MNKTTTKDWLKKFLFVCGDRRPFPDGRPLYAYKCTEKMYEELSSLMKFSIDSRSEFLPPAFCLFAAETWRRRHVGGPWRWQTVFDVLDRQTPNHLWIANTITAGMKWWRRELLRTPQGVQYLATIACEGGLPLKVLQKDNAALTQYFRQLLKDYYDSITSSPPDLYEIAQKNAHRLPNTLMNEIVFRLSADLIGKIIEFQGEMEESGDPLGTLDTRRPGWRKELPLPLEDEIVEHLLGNLVKESRQIAKSARQRFIWRTYLKRGAEEGSWDLVKELELPRKITEEALKRWSTLSNFPVRLRIFWNSGHEYEPIALMTKLSGEKNEGTYLIEPLTRKAFALTGKDAAQKADILVGGNEGLHPLESIDNHDLGELPWFFKTGEQGFRFLGEGSIETRAANVIIAVPKGGEFQGVNIPDEPLGALADLERDLITIGSSGAWIHEHYGICRFECGSDRESCLKLTLHGTRAHLVLDRNKPFIGIPALIQAADSRPFRYNSVQWRPFGVPGSQWYDDTSRCAGSVWLRYLGPNGENLLLKRAVILPEGSSVQLSLIGIEGQLPGIITFHGMGECSVECEQVPATEFEVVKGTHEFSIVCKSSLESPREGFSCRLLWPDGCHVKLTLPFPITAAAFFRKGKPIPDGFRIPIDRLAGVVARFIAPAGRNRFLLTARIHSKDRAVGCLEFKQDIWAEDDGWGRFELHRLQERLQSMLCLTEDLDAVAKLYIEDETSHRLAEIKAGFFEFTFEPDYDNFLLFPSRQSLEQMGHDGPDQISVKMIRLWKPDAPAVELPRHAGAIGWEVPIYLEPGPWLVLGEENEWPRFRPVLWVVKGEEDPSEGSQLQKAVREPESKRRAELLTALIEDLAKNPGHENWPDLKSFLSWTRKYPARIFDFLKYLAQNPEAMAMAIIMADDECFDAIWSLSEQLPFSWFLLPVNAWNSAADRYFTWLDEALKALPEVDRVKLALSQFESFKKRVSTRQPFFKQICDWLFLNLFDGQELTQSELQAAINSPEVIRPLVQNAEMEFQERHSSDEQYPPPPQWVMDIASRPDYFSDFRYEAKSPHLRAVRCIPFAAAYVALKGISYDRAWLADLYRFRAFDREWFDLAFALGLCLGLAELVRRRKEER